MPDNPDHADFAVVTDVQEPVFLSMFHMESSDVRACSVLWLSPLQWDLTDWIQQAATPSLRRPVGGCRTVGLQLFFPDGGKKRGHIKSVE